MDTRYLKRMKAKTMGSQIGCRVQGKFQCKVVDGATGRVIREFPVQKNLILNQGLDFYLSGSYNGWPQLFAYACAGTGTTPTQNDSGAVTVSQSGTTITTSAPFLLGTTADVGRTIKWDTGEEAMITAQISTTQATVNTTASILDAEFTIYETNQTKMGGGIGAGNGTTDVKRTLTYVTGTGDCGTTWTAPHVSELKRTYDFTAESGSVTYTEVGTSYSPTVNSPTLFMRAVLDTPVSLTAGQVLRFVYTLTVTWSPSASFNAAVPITGWPVLPATTVTATQGYDFLSICAVNTSGSTSPAGDTIDPGKVEFLRLYSVAYLPPATPVQTYTSRQTNMIDGVAPTYSTYVANSFTRTMTFTFTPSDGNSTSLRTMIVSYTDSGTGNYRGLWIACFDENQTKDSLHRLVVNFTYTVGRVLS